MHYPRGIDVPRRFLGAAAIRALLCAFVAVVLRLRGPWTNETGAVLPYAVVAAPFILNLIFAALARTAPSARFLAALQVWLDVVFVTALVYLTGGVGSDFLPLYFGPILAAGVSFRRSTSILVASTSTVGLFLSAVVYYSLPSGEVPLVLHAWIAEGRPEPGSLVAVLALQGAAFHLVAFLSATLAQRILTASIHIRRILENLSDGVVTVEMSGRVVFSNSRADAMLELDGLPVVGVGFWDVAPLQARDALHEVLRTGGGSSVEIEIGSRRMPVQVSVLPLKGHNGKLLGANVILHDLSERRRLTEALKRAERFEAAAATAASIAHEIRNPLAAIRGSAQELARTLRTSGPDRGLLDLVVGESDRLNRIITEFLNFNRMPKPIIAPMDIRRLLDEVSTQMSACGRGLDADVEVEGPDRLWIDADREQMKQVFLNLGLNALDATDGAGPVVFSVESLPEGAVIRTLDEGCGVDESIAEKVFEPFFTTKTAGTGLGLAVAMRIVEDHRGSLELADDEKGRTCIKVFIPFAEGSAGQLPSPAEAP